MMMMVVFLTVMGDGDDCGCQGMMMLVTVFVWKMDLIMMENRQ